MSYVSGGTIAPPLLFCFGIFIAVFGFMFAYLLPIDDFFFDYIGNGLIIAALVMIFAGLVLIPGSRRESRRIRSVLEIVAVRKEVSISDISAETGLEREYIRKIITNMLISHVLFGYLENDLFVRDTSGRPPFYGASGLGMAGTY